MTDDEFDAAVAHFRERLKKLDAKRQKDMTAADYQAVRDALTRRVEPPKHFADTDKDEEGEP